MPTRTMPRLLPSHHTAGRCRSVVVTRVCGVGGRMVRRLCECPETPSVACVRAGSVARFGAWCAVCSLDTVDSTALAPGPGQVSQRVCKRSHRLVSEWCSGWLPHGCRPRCAQHTRRLDGIVCVGRCWPHRQHLTIVCVCVCVCPVAARPPLAHARRCRVVRPCKMGKGRAFHNVPGCAVVVVRFVTAARANVCGCALALSARPVVRDRCGLGENK